jgi:uncharacterized protein YjeT (DUF2065 family)
MNKILLIAIGIGIVTEAIIAIFWKYNDKSIWGITARILRIVAGICVVVIGIGLVND